MVSKEERPNESEESGYRILSGIYRVVKSIDDKVEGFLEEIREFAEARSEDHYKNGFWDEQGFDPF
jgi:hypothetical protein